MQGSSPHGNAHPAPISRYFDLMEAPATGGDERKVV